MIGTKESPFSVLLSTLIEQVTFRLRIKGGLCFCSDFSSFVVISAKDCVVGLSPQQKIIDK
jgi:hypothetical protein